MFSILNSLLSKKIMNDKFKDVKLNSKDRIIEFLGNAFAILLLIAFFLKIVIF